MALLSRLIVKLKAKGKSTAAATAIATSVLQKAGDLKPGSTAPTAKGIMRGKLSPAALIAKDKKAKKKKKPK